MSVCRTSYAIWLALCYFVSHSNAILRTYNLTVHNDVKAPDGVSREVFLINGQLPGPLIEADEGDDLEIFVKNDLPVDTSLHWHGILQRGSPDMDGVPGVTQYPIPPGGNFTYRFSIKDQYGFFWYHSHVRAYYNDGIRGPLLIRPSPQRLRPFEKLAHSPHERDIILQTERDATSILLSDWTHELSDTIYARYFETGAFPNCVDSILANGFGRVECLPDTSMSAMPMSATMTMSDMSPSMTSLSPRGCMPPMMFRQGYNVSSLPPETCTNTSSSLLTIPADHTSGWLALNLVNSGAVSKLHVSLDAHSMFVYAADGLYVEIQEVKVLEIEIGQRYSVMIRLDQKPGNYYLRFASYPNGDMQQVLEGQAIVSYNMSMMSSRTPMNVTVDPSTIWMLTNGSAKPDTSVLNPQLLSPFAPVNPPSAPADQTYTFTINQTDIVTWVVNDASYSEPKIPIIQGNVSDGWQANTTIHVPSNSTIDIIMRIANDSMDTMSHPMHLHGHTFWVLGSGTGSFPYDSATDAPESLINLRNPPYRDTTNLPPSGWAVIRYVTDNPGAWIFHCHIQWHMVSGMALVLVEGPDQFPALIGQSNNGTPPATSAAPMRRISSRQTALTAAAASLMMLG
ncbi:Pc15g01510 [Penicillium rubens Wisconsin 54-1255]|uniref:Pc15g01510 protein n=1 Tax=Penicillium rubens (strain ATCC 28089 / DSM 1075 / NRRL 1951 / Wisconsin 54-1255) TaxID=500485 RepID=B6H691_PENRW|nr:Pc15g01510 [Penicillium rubens Wisconsin 54-1255]